MSGFAYRSGQLCAGQLALADIAAQIGTPFYAYCEDRLRANYHDFAVALADMNPLICYAVKANPNLAVIAALADCGAGADITSEGELQRAITAGVAPAKIIFSGVGKTRDSLAAALKSGIYQINAESIPEMHVIAAVARDLNITAPLALRVNPDIAADTHTKIATGEAGSKFGIDAAQLAEAMALIRALPSLDFKGFMAHIGSHLAHYDNFRQAYAKLAELVRYWRGQGFQVARLDLGGGVGIPYDGENQAPFTDYAQIVRESVGDLGCALAFEPGRRLAGDAGVLVAQVLYDKQGIAKRFLILDAGMNDLIRPAMYAARHTIRPLRESDAPATPAAIAGPVCETSDLFGDMYMLPGVAQGDLVAVLQAGAYGAAMSSTYNGRALIPEIMIKDAKFRIIRRRVSVAEQMTWER